VFELAASCFGARQGCGKSGRKAAGPTADLALICGERGEPLGKSTVLKLVNAGKFDEAIAGLTAWQYFTNPATRKKEISPALARRHKREQIFGRLDSFRPYTRAEIQSILRTV